MKLDDVSLAAETPADDAEILNLHEQAFGPGRFARAAERVREQGPHARELSFTARHEGRLVGSVRMTPVRIGGVAGHMLGPLAVTPQAKRNGIGGALIALACRAAAEADGAFVLLVGDEPYYGRHGFARVEGPVMPGPVDPHRLLVRWHGAEVALDGHVRHAARNGADGMPAGDGVGAYQEKRNVTP